MTGPDFVIPYELLPPGFASRLEDPGAEVAEPCPAATLVLLREGPGGLEVLLLRRAQSAAFVPGAYVFPGGRVDQGDAAAELVARLEGVTSAAAAERLALPAAAEPPAMAYYVAAIRETFEETGILVARNPDGERPDSAAQHAIVRDLWRGVLADEDAFPSVLDRLGCHMDGGSIEYIARWITPVAEQRRYDTRFFAATVPPGVEALTDPREASDALWITPEEALQRNREGRFQMVFPTLTTLASLTGFLTPRGVLDAFRARKVPTVLPRLVRTPAGVGIRADPEEE